MVGAGGVGFSYYVDEDSCGWEHSPYFDNNYGSCFIGISGNVLTFSWDDHVTDSYGYSLRVISVTESTERSLYGMGLLFVTGVQQIPAGSPTYNAGDNHIFIITSEGDFGH